MRLHLLDDQILVKRAPAETLSQGGVHIPDRDVARPLRGVVLAVGPGRRPKCACVERVPLQLRPGQEVLHRRYAGEEVVVDGDDCLILREEDVLGVLEDDAGLTVAAENPFEGVVRAQRPLYDEARRYTIIGDHDGHQWLCPVERYREVQAAIDAIYEDDSLDPDAPTAGLERVEGDLLTFTDPRFG